MTKRDLLIPRKKDPNSCSMCGSEDGSYAGRREDPAGVEGGRKMKIYEKAAKILEKHLTETEFIELGEALDGDPENGLLDEMFRYAEEKMDSDDRKEEERHAHFQIQMKNGAVETLAGFDPTTKEGKNRVRETLEEFLEYLEKKFKTTKGDVGTKLPALSNEADRFIVFGHIDSRSW